MPDLRYPIGRFEPPARLSPDDRRGLIDQVAALPGELRRAVAGLGPDRLDTPYRPGGWTVRQVVHHLPDSHINGYTRFKLALTEDTPAIKTYEEARWADLPEARTGPVEISLALLEGLHARWTLMLGALAAEQFARTFRHPEWGTITLDTTLALYGWHGRHHVAHITALRERMGW
jgi:hypothetical protein